MMKGIRVKMNYKESLEAALKNVVSQWGKSDIYYVGGYVRDEILDAGAPKDVDLVIDMPNGASEFCEFLKANFPTRCMDFVEYPRFGTAKFTFLFDMTKMDGSAWTRDIAIECVSPRKEMYTDGPRKPSKVEAATIEEDAMRRDFCCNALYKNVLTGEILDPTGHGKEDIKNRVLRTPCNPEITFKDDPLRMLRAIRFSAVKEFEISPETYKALKPIPEYYQLSMERVESEFTQILCATDPKKYIWILHDTGLLEYIIPELEEAWGFNQNSKYHSMNLTDHTLSVLEKVRVERNNILGLRLAALLHDISKYKYHETNEDGTFSYHDHEIKSAEMAEEILKRLKYSNSLIGYVCMLIRNHMGIKSQYDYSTMAYTGTKKSMIKFLNKLVDPSGERKDTYQIMSEMLSLIEADNLSHAPEWNMPGQTTSFREKAEKYNIIASWKGGQRQPTSKVQITGKDIMDRFGLAPGKAVGFLKDMVINDFGIDHPNYSKERLLDLVDENFGGDKKIYIFHSSWVGEFGASNLDPTQTNFHDLAELPLYLNEVEEIEKRHGIELRKDKDEGAMVVRAIEEPELYMRVLANREALNLSDEALKKIEGLVNMPDFKSVTIEYDYCNDARVVIRWRGHRPTIIY